MRGGQFGDSSGKPGARARECPTVQRDWGILALERLPGSYEWSAAASTVPGTSHWQETWCRQTRVAFLTPSRTQELDGVLMDSEIIEWLLEGDVAIQYQVQRDLLENSRPELQKRIEKEGWGARFLAARGSAGHWGRGFYQPKWTSTHYTLLDLRTLEASPDHSAIRESVEIVASDHKGEDGGINPAKTIKESDVCVSGMFLNYACYFGVDDAFLTSVVDYVLDQVMGDGGFNCDRDRYGAVHSSMHSTVCVLEGIYQYKRSGCRYRLDELEAAAGSAVEFLLQHQLFRSDRTGEIIHKDFLRLSFPGRWRYDILRALDCFRAGGIEWDPRMAPAIEVLQRKRRVDGRWPLQARIPGKTHFEMEQAGQPSRWNTLRVLRVLQRYPEQIPR